MAEQTLPEIPADLLEGAVDVSKAQDGGVRKVILREGSGDEKPGIGEEVVVHYTGTLTNGEKFDSSRDRDDKFKFQLGMQRVIKAWDEGVASMKKGELCRLICRYDYAYGEAGSPPKIPPKATLIFEVELFEWKGEDLSEDNSEGIVRSVKEAGTGYGSPNEGAQVKVDVKGTYEGRVFDDRSGLSFSVGDALEHQLPEGLDVAIRKFKKGERSVITLSSEYAFGSEGSQQYNIPADASGVKYEVTLTDFEKAKETWEMEPADKLSQAELAKTKGTDFFKTGSYKKALKKYNLVVKYMDDDQDYSDEQKTERNKLNLAAQLNIALCQLKMENWAEAREACNSALEVDSENEKAYFRRAQSFMGTKDWTEAKNDLNEVLRISPDNKAARNQLRICEQKREQEKAKEKKLYANMFSKSLTSANEITSDNSNKTDDAKEEESSEV